jgi:uncharacterized repeat protein (TIGR03803 family)
VLCGTTWLGGVNNQGRIFSVHTDGTGYQVLHSFLTNGVDGLTPWSGLALWHHTLYGTTEKGGTNNHGTIFSINTNGSAYTIFHSFVLASGAFTNVDGTEPMGDLMISGKTLYGTTQRGGSASAGTVFSLGLPRPGINVIILSGNNVLLTATNGVPGESYALVTSSNSDLPPTQWTSIATNVADSSRNITFSVFDVPMTAKRFYMLQME